MSSETNLTIDIDAASVGFVTAEAGAVRFHATDPAFATFEGAMFHSARQATFAARLHRERLLGLRPANRPAPRAA